MAAEMASEMDHWEALERALNETEVLAAINGGDEEDKVSASSFAIVAPDPHELDRAREALERVLDGEEADPNYSVPTLRIEIRTEIDRELGSGDESIDLDSGKDGRMGMVLRCLLPAGYPESAAAVVTSIQSEPSSLTRSSQEEVTHALNEKSEGLLGTEAVMDLVEEAKALCLSKQKEQTKERQQRQIRSTNNNSNGKSSQQSSSSGYGRRWIWVHHITSKERIKSILAEAESANLHGMLKHGYPGVVLVEGTSSECNAFVKWIKADKSSPLGGCFGRNWGHHVRGEISMEEKTDCRLLPSVSSPPCALSTMRTTDDLAVLADCCKDVGLEDEFREFVLQHKGG